MSNEEMSGAGLKLMPASQLNWYFLAHIIKDVLEPVSPAIVYGLDHSLMPILNSPEFGIETWGLYSNLALTPKERIANWPIAINDTYFGFNYCKLFVSVDYNPNLIPKWPIDAAEAMHQLMAKDGIILAINAGEWALKLDVYFHSRTDLEQEIYRYTLLRDMDVKVFQK